MRVGWGLGEAVVGGAAGVVGWEGVNWDGFLHCGVVLGHDFKSALMAARMPALFNVLLTSEASIFLYRLACTKSVIQGAVLQRRSGLAVVAPHAPIQTQPCKTGSTAVKRLRVGTSPMIDDSGCSITKLAFTKVESSAMPMTIWMS
jgi:hypothetical protein